MSWYRDDDGKIITDEEFQDCCCNCSAFCSEGTITVPCNGERTDCPYFKEVDTSEYDKETRAKAIDEFEKEIRDWQIDIQDNEYDANKFDFVFERIFEIAEQLKEGAE